MEIFIAYVTSGVLMGSLKKFSKFGPAVWPAIANIYIHIDEQRALLYRRLTSQLRYQNREIVKGGIFFMIKVYLS